MAIADIFGVGLNFGRSQNGYLSILADKRLVADDLKQLMLTSPGERVYLPSFGVGLDRFLFEQNTASTQNQIELIIRDQVATFLPIVNIKQIKFEVVDNELRIQLLYTIENYSDAINTLTIARDIVQ